MSGYIFAMIDVNDMTQYQEYMKLTPAIVEAFGGRFLTRGGQVSVLEGEKPASRMVLIEFPSYEAAVAMYNSAEYTAARQVREGAAVATFLALEGATP